MKQREIFNTFMMAVWNGIAGDLSPDTYDTFHDACAVAQCMGATGRDIATRHDIAGIPSREYLFPDGSVELVTVSEDGTGIGTGASLP